MEKENVFKWKHYQPDIILLTVRRYLRHSGHTTIGARLHKQNKPYCGWLPYQENNILVLLRFTYSISNIAA